MFSQKEDEHRALSNADTKYDALTQIWAIKLHKMSLNDNTIFWKQPGVTHFRSAFYGPVQACRSAQRAINNIYVLLPEHKHAFYYQVIRGRRYGWLMFYITPLSNGTPAHICIHFIFLACKTLLAYIFPLMISVYLRTNFSGGRRNFCSLRRGAFRPFKVIQIDKFGANRKRICDFLLVRNSNFGPILHRFGVITAFMCSWPTPIPP